MVLPAPLGPTRPIRSPARTSKASSVKTGSPTYCRPRPCAEIRIIYVTCICVLRPRNPSRCHPSYTDLEHASASTCSFNCRQSGSRTARSDPGTWLVSGKLATHRKPLQPLSAPAFDWSSHQWRRDLRRAASPRRLALTAQHRLSLAPQRAACPSRPWECAKCRPGAL